jgi:membrane protein implicated in regulation of membrane protease activity
MDWTVYLWFALMIVFVVMEAACPFHLVSIWFAVGALAAGIAAMLNGAVWLQVTLFFVVSCGLLLAMVPLIKKFVTPKQAKTNLDSVIGSQGYVTEAIDNIAATGQVKLGGMYWTARSQDGHPIAEGTLVEVNHIEGVKVFVTPVEVLETVRS